MTESDDHNNVGVVVRSKRRIHNGGWKKKKKKLPLFRKSKSSPAAVPDGGGGGLCDCDEEYDIDDDDIDDDGGQTTRTVGSGYDDPPTRSSSFSSSALNVVAPSRIGVAANRRHADAAAMPSDYDYDYDDDGPSPSALSDLRRVSNMIRDERHLAAYGLYVDVRGRIEEARRRGASSSTMMVGKKKKKLWWKQQQWGSGAEGGGKDENDIIIIGSSSDERINDDDGDDECEKAWMLLQEKEEEFRALENRAKLFAVARENLSEDDDWTHAQTLFGVSTSYRREPDRSLSVKIEGELHGVPLFEQLAVLRECDLYSLWAPFLSKSTKLAQIDRLDVAAWFSVGVPSLGLTRDACYRAVGCDCMAEDGGILLVAVGLNDTEEHGVKNGLKKKNGAIRGGGGGGGGGAAGNDRNEDSNNLIDTRHSSFLARDDILSTLEIPPIPAGAGKGRMTIRNFAASIDILTPTAARTKMVVNVDPNLQLIPQFMIDFCMKRMCGILLSRLQATARKVVKDPVKNPHARRMREDVRFYRDWLLPKFRMHCAELGWEAPRVGAFEIEEGDLLSEGTGWINDDNNAAAAGNDHNDDGTLAERDGRRGDVTGEDATSCVGGASSYAGTLAAASGGIFDGRPRPFERWKRLVRRGESREEKIARARFHAAERLRPEPFSEGRAHRLNELKAAKLRAEESRPANGDECGGGSSISSSSSSSRSAQNADVEDVVKRYVWLVKISLALHSALLLLRYYSFRKTTEWTSPAAAHDLLDMLIVALQSMTLWALLNSVLIYSFDEIDFGQKKLVSNMNFGKKLFVKAVNKLSRIVALSVATLSCGYGLAAGSFEKVCSLGDVNVSSISHQLWESFRRADPRKPLTLLNLSVHSTNALERALFNSIRIVTSIYRRAGSALSRIFSTLSLVSPGALKRISTSSLAASEEIASFVSSTHSRVCGSKERWGSRALDVSSFVTLRISVFVVALMLMGHLLLPKSERKARREKADQANCGSSETSETALGDRSVLPSLLGRRHSVDGSSNLSSMDAILEED